MKVFADYHHGQLYGSLKRLFEDRMGWELYRPIGVDWATQGWWRIAEPYGNAQDTINQYLAIDDRPYDSYKSLNGDHEVVNDIYHIYDPENDITHKAITLDTFKNMEFDYILGTHPLHETWEGLLQFQPKAKFFMQLGNENQDTNVKHVLSSVWAYQPKAYQNVCYYHQEFPLEGLGWSEPIHHTSITNMVHIIPHPELFDEFKNRLPEYQFKSYGMQNHDGVPSTHKELVNIIKGTAFGWHVKPADGYGYLIHQWYACGRPIITKGDYYLGKTGGLLLTDGETCIDLDRHTVKESIELIKYWSIPENHLRLCRQAYDRFTQVVDFDKEAESIKTFLSNIL